MLGELREKLGRFLIKALIVTIILTALNPGGTRLYFVQGYHDWLVLFGHHSLPHIKITH